MREEKIVRVFEMSLKLDNPIIKESVIKQLAVGTPQKEIAKQVELHQSQISRFANREDVRVLIEQEQLKLLDVVPDAVECVIDLVREFKDTPKDKIQQRKLIYKAISDVLKSVGLFATPIQSQTLVNIYNDNRTDVYSPEVLALLSKTDDVFDIDLGLDAIENDQ